MIAELPVPTAASAALLALAVLLGIVIGSFLAVDPNKPR